MPPACHVQGCVPPACHVQGCVPPACPSLPCRWLAAHPGVLGEVGTASVSSLGLVGRKAIVTVQPHTPTLLALERMLTSEVSAAPIICAETGAMIANLSVSDLR